MGHERAAHLPYSSAGNITSFRSLLVLSACTPITLPGNCAGCKIARGMSQACQRYRDRPCELHFTSMKDWFWLRNAPTRRRHEVSELTTVSTVWLRHHFSFCHPLSVLACRDNHVNDACPADIQAQLPQQRQGRQQGSDSSEARNSQQAQCSHHTGCLRHQHLPQPGDQHSMWRHGSSSDPGYCRGHRQGGGCDVRAH